MEKFLSERGSGKTTKLICKSYLNQIPIVVKTNQHRDYIKEMAHRMGLSIPVPLLFHDLYKKENKIRAVYIDDAESILKELFEYEFTTELKGFSMSTNDVEQE